MNTSNWWQTPHAWLHAWDFEHDTGRFLELDRAVLQRSSFLDQRIAADTTQFHEASLTELLDTPIRLQSQEPPAFIFHTAFCCSTLLARSLDIPGRTLGLREPATLLQLADLHRGHNRSAHSESDLQTLTLRLINRPFSPTERVIVKPTNLVNNIAPALFRAHPGTRALVLCDGLENFLLAVLKRPRESARGISLFLKRLLADPVGQQWLQNHTPPDTLASRAALVWSLQVRQLENWLGQDSNSSSARILAADTLIAQPTRALAACANWLNVELTTAEASKIVNGPIWTRHAKHPQAAYTPVQRRAEQARARELLSAPLREGMIWARKHGSTHMNLSAMPLLT